MTTNHPKPALTDAERAAILAQSNAYPHTVIAGLPDAAPTPQHPAVTAAAEAISNRLDLDRWERDGWPTIADDLAAAVTPAVLRAAAQHQRDHANRIYEMARNDQWLNGARRAAAILDSLAARLEP